MQNSEEKIMILYQQRIYELSQIVGNIISSAKIRHITNDNGNIIKTEYFYLGEWKTAEEIKEMIIDRDYRIKQIREILGIEV